MKKNNKTYCNNNQCEAYECIWHYSNAPWDELINVFSPTLDKEKHCKDYADDSKK